MSADPLDRFLSRVLITPCRRSCWLWTGYRMPKDYGQVWHRGQARLAHRVAWELLVGPIPAGMEVDHRCERTRCVNPAHLQLVTKRENLAYQWAGHGAEDPDRYPEEVAAYLAERHAELIEARAWELPAVLAAVGATG